MAKKSEPFPIISRAELTQLRTVPKAVPNDWKSRMLWDVKLTPQGTARLWPAVEDAAAKTFSIWARVYPDREDNYACGPDYDVDRYHYGLLRLDSAAGHVNHLPGGNKHRLAVTPHIHYVTEWGLWEKQRKPSRDANNWAVATTAFRDLSSALEVLAKRVHLTYAPTLGFEVPI